MLDPRLILLNVAARRLPTGLGDFAITEPVSSQSYIAVPVAITHSPPWQKRAWIIEPFDPRAEDNSTRSSFFRALFKRGRRSSRSNAVRYTSDDADMRAQPDEKRTAWRLRRRQILIGCQPFQEPFTNLGDAITLFKRQRVYGAEDYVL
jgi:hypothetical protein